MRMKINHLRKPTTSHKCFITPTAMPITNCFMRPSSSTQTTFTIAFGGQSLGTDSQPRNSQEASKVVLLFPQHTAEQVYFPCLWAECPVFSIYLYMQDKTGIVLDQWPVFWYWSAWPHVPRFECLGETAKIYSYPISCTPNRGSIH